MPPVRLDVDPGQIVMHTEGTICTSTRELVESEAFARVVDLYLTDLEARDSGLLRELGIDPEVPAQRAGLLDLLQVLAHNPLERVARTSPDRDALLARRDALHAFVEGLYDFWRRYDRIMVNHSEAGSDSHDKRPHDTFNETVEMLADLVRGLYRDVAENVTGTHPRVYRQVPAGCEMGVIAVQRSWPTPVDHRGRLDGIPFVRHVLLYPPLLLDPPANVRSGQFAELDADPLQGVSIDRGRFLCYPAVVGPLVVFVFVHQRFITLGLSLANLFEMASDEQIAAGPDAVFVYGAPPESLARFGEPPTVFHEDAAGGLLVGAVPLEDRFGYFGYLKKMTLTLHNLAVMKRGEMPFHGAFARIVLAGGEAANMLLIGDTATGKSETLEALRLLDADVVADLRIVADDMGSLRVDEGVVRAYGTEIGAFVRLDDLQQGYALGQVDRAVIMSPQKVNARVVLPVTTIDEVQHGYPVDMILYADNHEPVDAAHPVVERFDDADAALPVFRAGAAMAKGTTTATGLVSTYFANPFGPAQRRSSTRRSRSARSRPPSPPACTWAACARASACPGSPARGRGPPPRRCST